MNIKKLEFLICLSIVSSVKKILTSGGFLLGMSAICSKFLGLWRDRLLFDIFGSAEMIDLVFASFRIPDFFFYLLVGGTVSTLFLPRISSLNNKEKEEFFSSFLWGVVVFFGVLCGFGVIFTKQLIPLVAGGFEASLRIEMLPLIRMLFGSVFILSISSVFATYLQSKHWFFSLAIAPILYTGGICMGLFFLRDGFGIMTVGVSAIFGASLHFFTNVVAFFFKKGKIAFYWKRPIKAWKKFRMDFLFRVLNNSSFQINQSLDILIASFLMVGAVGAFSIGTNLGNVLLSIVGMSVANAVFPKFADAKHDFKKQKQILKKSLKWILFFTVPSAVLGAFFSEFILQFLFNLNGDSLRMANIVFLWTIVSCPLMCLIPVMSRVLIANDDIKTPMKISATSLFVATGVAAYLSLIILPPENAILGLALGNFTANTLSAFLFSFVLWRKFFAKQLQKESIINLVKDNLK